MLALILRRLAALIPILLIVSFAVFLLESLVPSGTVTQLAGGINATPATIAHVRAELHLNQPLFVQYWHWLYNAVHLNFGHSFLNPSQSVASEISQRLPVTLGLAFAAMLWGLLVGIPLGVIAGLRPNSIFDQVSRDVAAIGTAVPNFVLGLFLILIFAVNWHLLPSEGYTKFTASPVDWLRDIILPAIALGTIVSAAVARQLRTALLEVMNTRYIRTAWAMGLPPRVVVIKYALKNAAIPVITVIGLQIGLLLGGTVLIENLFSIPGLGSYFVPAITEQDIPVVQAVTLVFVLFAVGASLLADISYGLVNPKVRVK